MMRPRRATTSLLGAVCLVTLAAGCGDGGTGSEAAEPGSTGSSGPATADATCPKTLAPTSAPDGFEDSAPAQSAPSLVEPDRVWVCEYAADPRSRDTIIWSMEGEQHEATGDELTGLVDSVAALEPAPRKRLCTDDFGSRYLVLMATGDQTTGVVVDGYGCGDVRLTDDPAETPPGEVDAEDGLVPGVLTGPRDLVTLARSVSGVAG